MQQLLHLPKTMIPLNTLIIGYPKNQVAAKDKWKEENISYNKLDGEKFIIQEKEEEIGKKKNNNKEYEYQGELSTICKPICY